MEEQKTLDDKFNVVTSIVDTLLQLIHQEEEDKLKHNFETEAKLRNYESECKQYNLPKIRMIQKSVRGESGAEVCNLDDYAIGTLQCQIMFDALVMNPTTHLTSISLKNNHIEHFCCHSIAAFLTMSKSLATMNLEGCKFDDYGAIILSNGISKSKSVVNLNLANNNISDDGGESVVQAFITNDICKDLNLSSNRLSTKTSKMLQFVLAENETLRNLNLSHNFFYEDDAIVNVLMGLEKNKTLEDLNLSWNALRGESFGKKLSRAIRQSELKVLNLEHNQLSTFELKKLAFGLRKSETIEEVYVNDNLFLDGEETALINVFKSDSPLRFLSFGQWHHLPRDAFRLLKEIQLSKPFIEVIFKNVILPNLPKPVDILSIYADRAKYLAMSPKKKALRKDFGVFMMRLQKLETSYLPKSDVLYMLKIFKAKSSDALMEQYMSEFVVQLGQQKKIDIHRLASHYLNRHPYTLPVRSPR